MCYDHVVSVISKIRMNELLKRNKMSIDELAKLINASPASLRAMEKGNYDPPLSVAYKLAAALNVSIEKLYSEGEDVVFVGADRTNNLGPCA